MKSKILTFIIGALVGAIITTGVFMILKGNSKDDDRMKNDGPMGERHSMDGNMVMDGNMIKDGNPPDMPDENGIMDVNEMNS